MKKIQLLCLMLLSFFPGASNAQEGTFNLVGESSPAPQQLVADAVTGQLSSSSLISVGNPPLVAQAPTEDPYKLPELEIEGIDKPYPLGEMVKLGIKPMTEKPEFLESVTYSWTILPKREVVIWPDATKIFFGTGTVRTTYTVILNASYVYVEEAGKMAHRAVSRTVQVTVGGLDTPDPVEPNPVEPNPIEPNVPELTGLSKRALDWVKSVEANEAFKEDASTISSNFATVANMIEQGTLDTVDKIMAETKNMNDSKVKNSAAWMPWFKQMSIYLETEFSEGKLTTTQQFAQAWRQISAGLAEVNR